MEPTNARTVVLAPDIVWTLREFDYAVVDTAGNTVAEGLLKETAVMHRPAQHRAVVFPLRVRL